MTVNVVKDKKKSETRLKKGNVADESNIASHAADHTWCHASPMKHQNAEIVTSPMCTSCGKLNHFAEVCKTVPPNSVKRVTEEDGTDEDDYVYAVGEKKQPRNRLEIDGEYLEIMLDSEALVNHDLIAEVTYTIPKKLQRQSENSRTSQTANFILRVTHTPSPTWNNSRQDNCKIEQHIGDPVRCLRQFRKPPRV